MYRNNYVGVVVIAHDEEGFIGDVIRSLPEYVDLVIAVDDQSNDQTWPEILEAAAESEAGETTRIAASERPDAPDYDLADRAELGDLNGRVLPVQNRRNRGAGGAVKTGYMVALRRHVDIVVRFDGDGQMDPSLMSRFLDPIVDGRVEYTKGDRLGSSEFRRTMPRFRLIGNFMLTVLTKIASGYWQMLDPQNGYTAVSRQALTRIDVGGLYEYYGFLNDILVKLNVAGVRIGDVSMPSKYGDEQSGIDYRTFVRRVSLMLLQRFIWRIGEQYGRGPRVVLVGYYFGAGLSAASVLLFASSLFSVSALPGGSSPTTSVLTGVLAVLLGGWMLIGAMTLDRERNRDLDVRLT
jgi:glycosyltransferase involved in cell wall biosynthesis